VGLQLESAPAKSVAMLIALELVDEHFVKVLAKIVGVGNALVAIASIHRRTASKVGNYITNTLNIKLQFF
jgi:hypothetical protein